VDGDDISLIFVADPTVEELKDTASAIVDEELVERRATGVVVIVRPVVTYT